MARKKDQMTNMNVVLSKKVDSMIYNLMVKTTTDQVVDCNGYTLTEILSDIRDQLTGRASSGSVDFLNQKLEYFMQDDHVADDFRSLQDIYRYIVRHGDAIASLHDILSNTVSLETYSTFTEEVKEEIAAIKQSMDEFMTGYVTVETFEATVAEIKEAMYKNVMLSYGPTPPDDLIENGFWFHAYE